MSDQLGCYVCRKPRGVAHCLVSLCAGGGMGIAVEYTAKVSVQNVGQDGILSYDRQFCAIPVAVAVEGV
jgi:hypothetical protein